MNHTLRRNQYPLSDLQAHNYSMHASYHHTCYLCGELQRWSHRQDQQRINEYRTELIREEPFITLLISYTGSVKVRALPIGKHQRKSKNAKRARNHCWFGERWLGLEYTNPIYSSRRAQTNSSAERVSFASCAFAEGAQGTTYP